MKILETNRFNFKEEIKNYKIEKKRYRNSSKIYSSMGTRKNNKIQIIITKEKMYMKNMKKEFKKKIVKIKRKTKIKKTL